MNKFYEILFNPGEFICWSGDVYGTTLYSVEDMPAVTPQFFVINPLMADRRDTNCTALRNILVEFDSGTIEEQAKLLLSSGLPYSTLVHSGNKSLHAIISLEEPIATLAYYKTIAKKVILKIGADVANQNPSRFSRTPGALRDGQEQRLLEVNQRVPLTALLAWIGPETLYNYMPTSEQIRTDKLLPIRVKAFLTYGAPNGARNIELYKNACEMFRAGFTEHEIYDAVIKVLDLPEREIRQCIQSARRVVLSR